MAGVSVGTVSNVLKGRVSVSSQRRARVLAAIKELGFVRSEAARTFRAGTTTTVGMLVLDVRNPCFTDVALGAEDMAAKHHHSLILANTAEDPSRRRRTWTFSKSSACAVCSLARSATFSPAWSGCGNPGFPPYSSTAFPHGHFCSVLLDDVVGGRLAARHAGAATAVDETEATLQRLQTPDRLRRE
ncbi:MULTISPECIES: LacI family DNA-binding transcriptional regulator [Arthrobacter]|uniref:LacI family transcriptional regulator n=1 Tax=Arthrobacter terricola TaxID=2547396 RepID=A0A4R5KDH4_9MICC|nr:MULTISPECIES: LacI family DNA-binding transcriptional regulator [Arthrobacter]MBT8161756.1 LacI family DNA-binding transcriptional regulator [Arthrobacter sp. GN70]TDF92675.1 LacI family transcriptional regulator [Arthrobacter terricola]